MWSHRVIRKLLCLLHARAHLYVDSQARRGGLVRGHEAAQAEPGAERGAVARGSAASGLESLPAAAAAAE